VMNWRRSSIRRTQLATVKTYDARRAVANFFKVQSLGKSSSGKYLDKFWSNQDLMYDYKTELTGIGSRSFVNNVD